MKKVRRKTELKLWVRFVIALIVVSSLMTSIFLFRVSIINSKKTKASLLYNYKITQNSDYVVNLFDNSFIDESTLGANGMYISELVDNIDVNFFYSYTGSNYSNLTYDYTIVGTLIGEYQSGTVDNGEVWKKEYTFLDTKTKENVNKIGFNITEKINLDYSAFKDESDSFKKQLGMNINSKINVTMTIHVKGVASHQPIEDTKTITLTIPLSGQAFSITEDYQKNIDQDVYENVKYIELMDMTTFKLGIVLLIIFVVLLTLSFRLIFNIKPRTKFNKELYKILRTYGDIIVEVVDPIGEEFYNIINVKNFSEMVDLEAELRIPITFYEKIKNHYGEFVLIYNNVLYKFVLEDED